jgi:hypothetical protein
MSRIVLMTSTIVATAILPATGSAAPTFCGVRGDVLMKLASDFREQPTSTALTSDGQLLEVLRSESGMTWSIILTSPDGLSCLVATGESWQDKLSREVPGPQT